MLRTCLFDSFNKTLKLFGALLIFFTLPLSSEESPLKLRFRDLNASYYGKIVEVRGFLYKTKGGDLILSSEPNLSTCCIGKKGKESNQIRLIGEKALKETKFPVAIKGIFSSSPLEGKGKEAPFYIIKEASIVEKSPL